MAPDVTEELLFSAAFPLPFRVLCLAGLGILGWATNLHGLYASGIDPISALDLRTHDGGRLTPLPTSRTSGLKSVVHPSTVYRPVYRLFIAYSIWTFLSWTIFRYASYGDVYIVDAFKFIPAIAALWLFMVIICPFDVFQKPERDRFLHSIHRCIFLPHRRIYFSDVVFADVFTSFAKVLGDVWLSFYMLLPGGSLLFQPAQTGLTRWILPTIMSLPYAVRLRQCLVEYTSPLNDSRRPLLNALKYASAFPVIYLSAAQRIVVSDLAAVKGDRAVREAWHGEHQLFRLWLLAAGVNSLYSFWWDVTYDWGFDLLLPRASANSDSSVPLRPLLLPRLHPQSPVEDQRDSGSAKRALSDSASGGRAYPFGLRPRLLFPLPVYPFVILVDLVLRLTWSAKLSSHLHSYGDGDSLIFWIELAEIMRRWMWVFIRVEWEVVKDARASREAPRSARRDDVEDEFEMIQANAERHTSGDE
ncbi:EXS-domain-containing protein [Obba rivulosa]|uniref:EXS-domain-containing protein n=1 Tax=Obba rivulosa TaxID=1052685 RepID=A0A8E2DL99_9APHY|nr:EXS-domain-containing protein [Obba rivulosa]